MSNPKISVIMPVYNQDKYVAESITSVLKQTEPDFELIIIDDASTDDSLETIELYASLDSRIRVFKLDKNSGQAPATNYGASYANGEYMAWHHGDDNYHPEFIEKTLATKADVVYTAYAFIGVDGNKGECLYDLKKFEFDLDRLKKQCYLSCLGMVYKRSIFEELGGYDESFETCTDWDFSIRACQAARTIELVPEALAYYREYNVYSNRHRISESIRNDNRKRIGLKHGTKQKEE